MILTSFAQAQTRHPIAWPRSTTTASSCTKTKTRSPLYQQGPQTSTILSLAALASR